MRQEHRAYVDAVIYWRARAEKAEAAIALAVEAEREACARVAEGVDGKAAASIRERGVAKPNWLREELERATEQVNTTPVHVREPCRELLREIGERGE